MKNFFERISFIVEVLATYAYRAVVDTIAELVYIFKGGK